MVNPCPDGFSVTWHFRDPYDGNMNASIPVDYRRRRVVEHVPFLYGYEKIIVGSFWGWESYTDEVYIDGNDYGSLKGWHDSYSSWAGNKGYFTIDPGTRSRCFSPLSTPPSPLLFFPGTASPPPPPPRKMCGCDCNTIASIIAEYMAEKQRLLDAIKDHVDVRTLEQLRHINKMLQDIDMDLDLQPVINELKRVEKNLWNGINGG